MDTKKPIEDMEVVTAGVQHQLLDLFDDFQKFPFPSFW